MQPSATYTPAPPTAKDEEYQLRILQEVSRTFALTIPQLPPALARAVSNAYLLCRIADTIEDDPDLPAAKQRAFAEEFIAVVEKRAQARAFAHKLHPQLSNMLLPAERDLVSKASRVLRITHSLSDSQQTALARCVRIMADGMAFYQEHETLEGLADQAALDRYCYYVAGVVGEMLTEMFCEALPEWQPRRAELMQLAVSFGQGLQMTNILKDLWEDRLRGACWLPRSAFAAYGVELNDHFAAPASGSTTSAGFARGLRDLIAIAHGHLRHALTYTLAIPPREQGMRRFCLWALFMAVLTLNNIAANPHFRGGREVKISRTTVKRVIAASNLIIGNNALLRVLFNFIGRQLPRAAIS